jgi:hypothetical protein
VKMTQVDFKKKRNRTWWEFLFLFHLRPDFLCFVSLFYILHLTLGQNRRWRLLPPLLVYLSYNQPKSNN